MRLYPAKHNLLSVKHRQLVAEIRFAAAAKTCLVDRFDAGQQFRNLRNRRPQRTRHLLAPQNGNIENLHGLNKDLAVLNGLDALLPGREVLALFEPAQVDLITIPKPVLTSGEKTAKTSADQSAGAADAYLTIVVEAKE